MDQDECWCDSDPDFKFLPGPTLTGSLGSPGWCFPCLERAAAGLHKSVAKMMSDWENDGWIQVDLAKPQARLI